MDYCSGLENRRSVAIRGRGFETHTFLQNPLREYIVYRIFVAVFVLVVVSMLFVLQQKSNDMLFVLQQKSNEIFINKFETNCTERGGRVIHDGNEFLSAPSTKTSQRIIAMCVNNGKIIE